MQIERNVRTFVANTLDDVLTNAIQHLHSINQSYDPNNYEHLIELANRIGNVETGISNIDLIAPKQIVDEKIKCPICMDETTNIRKTICNHFYCCCCIEKWLKTNKKCPVCMKEFTEPSNIYADE